MSCLPLCGRQEDFCKHPLGKSGGLKLFISITATVAVTNELAMTSFLTETGLFYYKQAF